METTDTTQSHSPRSKHTLSREDEKSEDVSALSRDKKADNRGESASATSAAKPTTPSSATQPSSRTGDSAGATAETHVDADVPNVKQDLQTLRGVGDDRSTGKSTGGHIGGDAHGHAANEMGRSSTSEVASLSQPTLSRTASFYPESDNPNATLAVKLLPASSGVSARRARIVPEWEHLSRLANRQVALGAGTGTGTGTGVHGDSAGLGSTHGYDAQWFLFYVDHDGDVLDICDQESLTEAIYNVDPRHPCWETPKTAESGKSGVTGKLPGNTESIPVKPLVLYVYLPGQRLRKDCNQAIAAEIRERFHEVSGNTSSQSTFSGSGKQSRSDASTSTDSHAYVGMGTDHNAGTGTGTGMSGIYPVKHNTGDVSVREQMEQHKARQEQRQGADLRGVWPSSDTARKETSTGGRQSTTMGFIRQLQRPTGTHNAPSSSSATSSSSTSSESGNRGASAGDGGAHKKDESTESLLAGTHRVLSATDTVTGILHRSIQNPQVISDIIDSTLDGLQRGISSDNIIARILAIGLATEPNPSEDLVDAADSIAEYVGRHCDSLLKRTGKAPGAGLNTREKRLVGLLRGGKRVYANPEIAGQFHALLVRLSKRVVPRLLDIAKASVSGQGLQATSSIAGLLQEAFSEVVKEPDVLATVLEVAPYFRAQGGDEGIGMNGEYDVAGWLTKLLSGAASVSSAASSAAPTTSNLVETGLQQLRGKVDEGLRAIGARGDSNLNKGLQVASGILQFLANAQTGSGTGTGASGGASDSGAGTHHGGDSGGHSSGHGDSGSSGLGSLGQTLVGSFMKGLTGASGTSQNSHDTASQENTSSGNTSSHSENANAHGSSGGSGVGAMLADMGMRALHGALSSRSRSSSRDAHASDSASAPAQHDGDKGGDGAYTGSGSRDTLD